jgi:hypothetical protein
MNTDIHGKPIGERIDWLYDVARRYSAAYCDPEASMARERYLALAPHGHRRAQVHGRAHQHSGRHHTPLGIIQPFRNLGGMFDLGWPHLGEVLATTCSAACASGRRVLLLITYHFSRGSVHRGCAGFHGDTAAAIEHTRRIKQQVETVFGQGRDTVYPVLCGFETDEDALLVHGEQGGLLDLAHAPAWPRTHWPAAPGNPCFPTCPPDARRPAAAVGGQSAAHRRGAADAPGGRHRAPRMDDLPGPGL